MMSVAIPIGRMPAMRRRLGSVAAFCGSGEIAGDFLWLLR
jgi:hypothetical protein